MLELVIVGIVSALVGAAAGIKGLQRHQARLEAQRAWQHRRQSWLVFLGMAVLALVALVILAGVIVTLWQSPAQFFFGVVYRLALVMEMVGTFGFYMGDLIQALPGFSFVGLFFFAGFATLFSVLWLVAFKQLTGARRMA